MASIAHIESINRMHNVDGRKQIFYTKKKKTYLQDIQQLELLCNQMYQAQDSSIRSEAEKALVAFQDSCDALPKCQQLLDRGDSSYSQLLAATTLTKLISKNVQGLSLQQRIDIRCDMQFKVDALTNIGSKAILID